MNANPMPFRSEEDSRVTMKKFLFWTVFLPSSTILIALTPGVNFFLFSLHGGLGWLALYVSGPLVICRLIYGIWFRRKERLPLRHGILFLAAYILITFPLGLLATSSLNEILGAVLPANAVWKAANIPWCFILLLFS